MAKAVDEPAACGAEQTGRWPSSNDWSTKTEMRLHAALLAVLAGSCAVPPAERFVPPSELAGRTAGAPQQCVSLRATESLRVSETDRHTLIYGSGGTLWASQLGQCGFGSDDVLVTEPTTGSYYCRGDLVRSLDRSSHIPGPSCVLGDFVPYRR